MLDINARLDQILKQLEDDRLLALAEYAHIQAELTSANPQFKHLSREVGVQALRLAVDASINMAKAISTLTKDNTAGGSIGVDRKELLKMLDDVDRKGTIDDPNTEVPTIITDELSEEEEKIVADEEKLLAEIDEIIDASQAEVVQK